MNCSVFRSAKRELTYLYLLDGHKLDDLPPALLSAFGIPEFVIALELSGDRKLAQEDVHQVMENLEATGFHLQMPPGDEKGLLL